MIGIVVVSHSRALADAVVELATQMTSNDGPTVSVAAGARHAREQPPRVGMRGASEERVGRRRLHLLAGVHDHHAVADLVRGSQIVGGEEHRHPALLHQLAQ